MKIRIPYRKGLSENSYKIGKTKVTKKHVKIWMSELVDCIRQDPDFDSFFGNPVKIKLYGYFTDNRCPDLSNLHKVIGDAVEDALGMNDRYFRFEDLGFETGHYREMLGIELELL